MREEAFFRMSLDGTTLWCVRRRWIVAGAVACLVSAGVSVPLLTGSSTRTARTDHGEVSRSELRMELRALQKQLAKLRKEHVLNTNVPPQVLVQVGGGKMVVYATGLHFRSRR